MKNGMLRVFGYFCFFITRLDALIGLTVVLTIAYQTNNAEAVPIAVPIHRVAQTCQERGFPLVIEQGILGCDKSGVASQWHPFFDGQSFRPMEVLPEGGWFWGTVLFRSGTQGGLWDPDLQNWSMPRRRVSSQVAEGQGFATEQYALWTTAESVQWLSLETGVQRSHSARPLQGQHPVLWGDFIGWVEWGSQPGIHLLNIQSAESVHIPSTYPTSLVATAKGLYWICGGDICQWTSNGVHVQGKQRVQALSNTERGLCWTQWLEGDVDILCEGDWRLDRKGDQGQPVWREGALYFIESGRLWVYEEP